MSDRKILYVINPIAGTRSKQQLEQWLAEQTDDAGIDFEVLHTRPDTTSARIATHAQLVHATDVVACGGDGTVNKVAGALLHAPLRMGIIPVGSGNGLARAAGIPMQPAQALPLLWKGHLMHADSFTINNQFACMLAGVGLDAAVAQSFAKSGKRGLATYTTQTLIHYFKSQPYPFEVTIDGYRFHTDAFFISVANSNQYGNNVTIAPKASISDGLLDIIIVQKMSKLGLPFAVMRQLSGNYRLQQLAEHITRRHVVYLQARELHIHNLNMAPLHIDGDPAETARDLHFALQPATLPLWVPASH